MSKDSDSLHINIQAPQANGSKVAFSFTCRGLPLQPSRQWYIDYQDFDVSHVSSEVFTLVFLAWQLPLLLQSDARNISITAEYEVSADLWIFIQRMFEVQGLSMESVHFEGLVDRRPSATDGTPEYGYRQRRTLCVVPDGLPHGLLRAVMSRIEEPRKSVFRSVQEVNEDEPDSALNDLQYGLTSGAGIISNFRQTQSEANYNAFPSEFSSYVIAAIPALIAGGFTRYATFFSGNRFWRNAIDGHVQGSNGERTENFQALSDFMATAINYPVQFANMGRSLSNLGAARALNTLAPSWTAWHDSASNGQEASRRPDVSAFAAALAHWDSGSDSRARDVLRNSRLYKRLSAAALGQETTGGHANAGWDSRLGILDFEHMELIELCHQLVNRMSKADTDEDRRYLEVLIPYAHRSYPDLWNLRIIPSGEYKNGFEECIAAVLEEVLEASYWLGDYPLRSGFVQLTNISDMPRPWPMSFRGQQASGG